MRNTFICLLFIVGASFMYRSGGLQLVVDSKGHVLPQLPTIEKTVPATRTFLNMGGSTTLLLGSEQTRSFNQESQLTAARDTETRTGWFIDPDDPTIWPSVDNAKVVLLGESMDADDYSVWFQDEDSKAAVIIGESVDADDFSVWPPSENLEPVIIGERMYPDDPSSWFQSGNSQMINVGGFIDADVPTI